MEERFAAESNRNDFLIAEVSVLRRTLRELVVMVAQGNTSGAGGDPSDETGTGGPPASGRAPLARALSVDLSARRATSGRILGARRGSGRSGGFGEEGFGGSLGPSVADLLRDLEVAKQSENNTRAVRASRIRTGTVGSTHRETDVRLNK